MIPAFLLLTSAMPPLAQTGDPLFSVSPRARELHRQALVVDTHDDTTQRLIHDRDFDLGRRNATGHVDLPRMREGGLDAIFFSIWVPVRYTGTEPVKRALQQIDAVHEAVRRHPNDLVLATTVDAIRRAHQDRKIAALMGAEGGHLINDDLAVLRQFAARGVRYLTLTHTKNTSWADSSGDKSAHNGLTEFGRMVVRELNRLGVMVDVSHVSDKTFADVLAVTQAPVLASHSSCRAISSHARNLSDEMLRALARNGGVVMINFNQGFLSQELLDAERTRERELRPHYDAMLKSCGNNDACQIRGYERLEHQFIAEGKLPPVGWEKIVDHIEHAVKVAGVDHVGLGSDFDGASMPTGMEDVSKLPKITEALRRRGYPPEHIEKILGGNVLRVLGEVERASHRLQAAPAR
jgi:membrane dipeptidase